MTKPNKLNLLWTNDNIITSKTMVFMYGINSKRQGWWDEVTIIIWGAPALLVAENEEIQNIVEEAQLEGVQLSACKACVDQLGVTEKLENLNIEVKYWGDPLTKIMQSGAKLITV